MSKRVALAMFYFSKKFLKGKDKPLQCQMCCMNSQNHVAQKLKEMEDIPPNKNTSEENM